MKSFVCITGASGGLGKAFAVECASRGWDLFITDLSEEALFNLSEGLKTTYGVKVVYYPCDLTDHELRTVIFKFMEKQDMRFWSVINNAGLDYEGPFVERNREQIRTILRLNIEANLEITYQALKLRDKEQTFRVINVSSLAAFYPMPVKATYACSKRFLLDFSRALREEIRPLGGTVTVLCPAGMPTNPACIRAIDAQGFMGRITTQNVGFVAAETIDYALKGYAVYIPGRLNRVIKVLGSFVPPTIVARLISNRWIAAHKKTISQSQRSNMD